MLDAGTYLGAAHPLTEILHHKHHHTLGMHTTEDTSRNCTCISNYACILNDMKGARKLACVWMNDVNVHYRKYHPEKFPSRDRGRVHVHTPMASVIHKWSLFGSIEMLVFTHTLLSYTKYTHLYKLLCLWSMDNAQGWQHTVYINEELHRQIL